MNRFRLVLALCFVIFCGATVSACALMLDWDPEGLPCEDNQICADGYSCLVNSCILENSIAKGETCNRNIQCAGELVCANFTCASPCTKYYESSAECPLGEYCMEHVDENGNFAGHCQASALCTVGEPCQEGRMCIEITTGSNACLLGCEISWSGEVYSDSCGGSQGVIKYCQPLGKRDQLVCRDTSVPGQEVGQPCDLVENTCSRGLACVNGICKRYCNLELPGNICGSEQCCDQGTYGVCDATCEI